MPILQEKLRYYQQWCLLFNTTTEDLSVYIDVYQVTIETLSIST